MSPEETLAATRPRAGGRRLAAFYDRRAPAALAYCARLCAPEAIGEAVEEAFARVFANAPVAQAGGDDELERRLRSAVRAVAAAHSPPPSGAGPGTGRLFERGSPDPWRAGCEATAGLLAARADRTLSAAAADGLQEHLRRCRDCRRAERRFHAAERAYDALAGDDAPALGRPLLAEMVGALPVLDVDWAADPEPRPEAGLPPGLELGPEPEPEPEPQLEPRASDTAESPALESPRSRWRRRLVIVLAVAGTLLLAEAVVTLAWKEPFTGYLAAQAQDDLSRDLDRLGREQVSLAASERRSLAAIDDARKRATRRVAFLAARLDRSVEPGEALGRIQIDRLGADYVFVQGTGGADLRKGPGHYHPTSLLPGEGGAVGIAGHRTTYEAPFREIDSLRAGDRIVLRMPYGLFTYEVTGHRIVPADYSEAFAHGHGERLVLSACHPLYSATERILVEARLVSSEPLGAAVETAQPATVPSASAEEIARRRTEARLERLGDRYLSPGTSGDDVRELQRLLGMPVTGVFDADTGAAVLAFQGDHGLEQVGSAGPETKRALARRPHLPSRPPTPAAVPEQQPSDPAATPGTTTPAPSSGVTGEGP